MSRPLSRRRVLGTAVGLAATAVVAPACAHVLAGPTEVAVRPVADWRREFDAAPPRDHYTALALDPDPKGYYELAYGVDAYTMMFEATGDPAYLDVALGFAEGMIAQARPSSSFPTSAYRDEYLTWVSQADDVVGEEVPLYESYCWRYVFRSLRVLRESGVLGTDPSWRRRHDAVLAFGERNVVDKWFTRGPDENIYRSRTHMASHWAFIATSLEVLTSDPGRATRCREIYTAVDRQLPNYPSSLRAQLRPSAAAPGAYDWSDVWAETSPSQDVSHGNNVVSYVVEAHDRGREWTDGDMRRFVATLGVIWPPGQDAVSEFVDGSGEGDGWLSDGWVKLGRYDSRVQRRLEGHGVRDGQFVAALALNARRLAEGRGS